MNCVKYDGTKSKAGLVTEVGPFESLCAIRENNIHDTKYEKVI